MYHDEALIPAKLYVFPSIPRFQDSYRRWQGIPSIAVTKRYIYVNFYSGQEAEVGGNIMVLCRSEDNGSSFHSCVAVVEHPHPECRIYDPNLWVDPLGRLWMFWTQAHGFYDGRSGVFAAVCDAPDQNEPIFSAPRRIANGVMMNKPISMSNGEWLFPCAIWCDSCGAAPTERHGLEHEQFSNVYVSSDQGRTILLRGHSDVPDRQFDEHMVIERKDRSLWMLVRTYYGIGESFSYDFGLTWSKGQPSAIPGPCSRFHISRLSSGRMLLINHKDFGAQLSKEGITSQGNVKTWKGRTNLTAFLSEDEGKTWPYSLLLDSRPDVSYPDAAQGEDGVIYVTYDRDRVNEREILLARITEQDILAGKLCRPESALAVIVNKATGI